MQQFEADTDPLALTARQLAHQLRTVLREAEVGENLVDPGPAFLLVRIGEAELGPEGERLVDGQLVVEDVVLGDVADAVPQGAEVGVEIAAVEADRPGGRRFDAGDRLEQCRLACPARAEDGEERVRRHARR